MITRRYREPRGLNSQTADYGFFVRVSGEERNLLKAARELAERRLGGPPSNPMLLLDMMSVYVANENDNHSDIIDPGTDEFGDIY